MKPKIFVSFDYENDRQYKYLLEAFNSNPYLDFSFHDRSSSEIQSNDISRVKAALTRKINEADYTLVIIGSEANKLHKDRHMIGYRNWQNYEIAKSKELGKRLIGIKLKQSYDAPEELYGSGARWAYSFSVDGIRKALQ